MSAPSQSAAANAAHTAAAHAAHSAAANAAPAGEPNPELEQPADDGFLATLMAGTRSQSWAASFLFHVCLFLILALVLGTVKIVEHLNSAPTFVGVPEPPPSEELSRFEVGDTPLDPTELTTESLTLYEAPKETVDAQYNDDNPIFMEAGGGSEGKVEVGGATLDIRAVGIGPVMEGSTGIGAGGGTGLNAGKGGAGSGFGTRGQGMREAMLGNGGTKQSERAVAAALHWLSRHQNPDGSWSIDHSPRCVGGKCSGPGGSDSDAGATALGLLPYLAAGQTHDSVGPYKAKIDKGIKWLISKQKADGDLSAGASQMYSHGLATIALCEDYGMTGDSRIGQAAQKAIDFIVSGQNAEGGWRYTHGSADSDLSVMGWQVMALKSGQMAGLKVGPGAMDKARKYLEASAVGDYKDRFAYMPRFTPNRTMTSVGMLLSQYLGAGRDSPVVMGGATFLTENLPTTDERNVYYWYYATQAMHNYSGPQWDVWNRAMRRLLIETQDKKDCAAGSWDPEKPSSDAWGKQGGRLMLTSLSCLTLEVYYRYLPLYKLDGKTDKKPAGAPKAPAKTETN